MEIRWVEAVGLRSFVLALSLSLFAAPWMLGCSTVQAQERRPSEGKVVWELTTGDALPAPVQRAAIDPASNTVYLATFGNLYAVTDGAARAVSKPPAPDARIGLAPGGGLYVWLIPIDGPAPLWEIYLRDISGGSQIRLEPQGEPKGFGGLYLGDHGKLIVTFTPIDDWRGIWGRYRFTFWNRDGHAQETIIRPTPTIGIVAADGSSLLLLGEKEATAYSSGGEKLWSLEGSFRKGAITKGGDLALLNPSDVKQINRVVIYNGSRRTEPLVMPTPVHHLILAPDGSNAVVGGDQGRYFHLDPASGRFEEGARLPFDSGLFLTDIEFVDPDTLAFGVLQQRGDPPNHTWPTGAIVVVTRGGKVLFRRDFQIEEPFASRPAMDVAYGKPTVVGFTMEKTVRVDLGR